MKSFSGFRITVYLQFLLPLFVNSVGTTLVVCSSLASQWWASPMLSPSSSLLFPLLSLLGTIQTFQGWNSPALWLQIASVGFFKLKMSASSSRCVIQVSIWHFLGCLVDISHLPRATLESLATTCSLPQKTSLPFASWSHPPFYTASSTLIRKSHLKKHKFNPF